MRSNLGRISVGPPYFGFMFVLLMLPVVLLLPFGPIPALGAARDWRSDSARAAARRCCSRSSRRCSRHVLTTGLPPARASPASPRSLWVGIGIALYAIKRWRDAPRGTPLYAGNVRHDPGALRRRAVPRRRADHRSRERREATCASRRTRRRRRRSRLSASTVSERAQGPELRGRRRHARRCCKNDAARRDAASAEAPVRRRRTRCRPNRTSTRACSATSTSRSAKPIWNRAESDGAWAVRVYVKPFVRWIWLGGLFMMLGGFVGRDGSPLPRGRQNGAPMPRTPAQRTAAMRCRREPPHDESPVAAVRVLRARLPARLRHLLEHAPRPERSAVAADRQAGARVHSATARTNRRKTRRQSSCSAQPYLLNVFGSWCPTCRYEHPVLTQQIKPLGIKLVGLN